MMVLDAMARAKGTKRKKLFACDESRASFDAPSVRPAYVKIIDADWGEGGENRCGKSNASMYGTRGVALNWHEHCK